MAIIELHERSEGRGPLYLNTDHIVSIQRADQDTWVTVSTPAPNGGGRIYVVIESPEHVVDLIKRSA